jgi:ParB family chromosome partitioning protein
MLEVREIPISLIDEGGFDQRFELNEESIEELAGSIRRLGILVPLIIRPAGERFVRVAGRRRLAAAKKIGLSTVPCVVREMADIVGRETAFAENLFREDLTPIETAVAIAKAVEGGEADVQAVADGMRRSVDWVRRQLAMLEWPEDVLKAVHRGQLSVAAAANLACVEEPVYRAYLLENAIENGATARTTAAWLQAWRASVPAPQAVQVSPLSAGSAALPLIPQAPCFCCSVVGRTDELSHVPLCARCIGQVRRIGAAG